MKSYGYWYLEFQCYMQNLKRDIPGLYIHLECDTIADIRVHTDVDDDVHSKRVLYLHHPDAKVLIVKTPTLTPSNGRSLMFSNTYKLLTSKLFERDSVVMNKFQDNVDFAMHSLPDDWPYMLTMPTKRHVEKNILPPLVTLLRRGYGEFVNYVKEALDILACDQL